MTDRFATHREFVGKYEMLVYDNPVVADFREWLALANGVDPGRAYIVDGDRTLTYGDLLPRVAGLSAFLVDELGVSAGARIAVAAMNSIEWVLTAWAAAVTGRVLVGLNSWWHPEELIAGITVTEPEVLVVDERQWERLARHLDRLPSIRTVLLIGATAEVDPRVRLFPEVRSGSLPLARIDIDAPLSILFTSGTTGDAKGAVLTHRVALSTLQNVAWMGERYFPTVSLRVDEPSTEESVPCTVLSAPMFHVAGLHWGVMIPIASGTTVVLNTGRFDPERVLDMVVAHRATSLGGVPTTLIRVIDSPTLPTRDLSSVTSVSWGGAPPPTDLVDRCIDAFPNLALVGTGYGLTETCGLGTYIAGTDLIAHPGSVGKALPCVEIRICGDDGLPLPSGRQGEVQMRGPIVMPGYWNRPDASRAALTAEGWLRTGDLGVLDSEGYLTLTGRSKEIIIRGGENVYPVEIESVLMLHPDVLDAGVAGRAHPDLGEEVIAVVQVTPNSTVSAAELRTLVGQHLAAFKVPVEVNVGTGSLPRNAAGKLMRDAIAGARLRLTQVL
jgi:long-chain acyl-CoA synthetase